MVSKLPLDSPLWDRLSACYSSGDAVARLRDIVETRQLGEAWDKLCDEILHQGSVYGVSSAAIPHLVDVAPHLPQASRRDLWIKIGFLVTAGADQIRSSLAPGLREGLTAALREAETLAVRDFLADTELTPGDSCYYALACIALAGHPAGRAMWQFPSPGEGSVRVVCPTCRAEWHVDGFADPLAPPCLPPAFAAGPGNAPAWHDVADAIERSNRDQALGPGWGGFFDAARRAAVAGVPPRVSPRAVWCLVAAMVATTSAKAAPWARTLARLAGHVRCFGCGRVWAIADALDAGTGAEPVEVDGGTADSPFAGVQGVLFLAGHDGAAGDRRSHDGVPAATVADGVAGFAPAPGRKLHDAQVTAHTLWRVGIGAVDALAPVTGHPSLVVAGTCDAATVWDTDTGDRVGPPLAGPAFAVASIALPDGRTVIATAGDDGSLRWWDALTGRPLGGAAAAGTAPIISLAPVRMPSDPGLVRVLGWLAPLRDGRTVLAAGDADGVVRLWDPATHAPLKDLFQRAGLPVVSLTAVDFVNQQPWCGTDLVAVYGDLTIDVWASAAVHGQRSGMAPAVRKLAAAGHSHVIGVAVSPQRLGHRRPVLLADRNGTVSVWETFGVRLRDPLPPDPAHREVVAVAALPGAGDGITVATASRAGRTLRLWEPLSDHVALVPLDVQSRCLQDADGTLLIGHDDGLLALSLSRSPIEG